MEDRGAMTERIVSLDWIGHHARTSPGRIACIDLRSGRRHTYAAFDERIARLAHALTADLGVCTGDRVLVLSHNDTDVFEIQFACQRLAAIFVPLNWRLSVVELQAIAEDAAATVLFYGSEFRDTAQRLATARSVEMAAGQDSDYERSLGGKALRGGDTGRRESDTWALLYTSGTTGNPKGVQITYGMAFCNAVALGSAFGLDADSRNLVVLPLFHTGGLNVFANPVFFHGGVNLVLREFDPGLVVRLLADGELGVTHMLAVPTIHAMLMAEQEFDRLRGTALKGLCVAGAPCPVPIIERYATLGLSLRQCWGMTEAGPLALIMPRAATTRKHGSSGLPSMFADVRIVGADGAPLSGRDVGELLVRGPAVTPGYWNKADANEAAFTGDGWLRTGDAAYRDAEGYVYIVDRWKDMFISGGENIYPAEIERVIALIPEVAECAVVAMRDAKWGEVGRAFVVRRGPGAVATEAIRAHCALHLARYKVPKEFVFIDALPRNSTGKILKAKLREAGGPGP
jgi:fatty-acyl-CoA synthase